MSTPFPNSVILNEQIIGCGLPRSGHYVESPKREWHWLGCAKPGPLGMKHRILFFLTFLILGSTLNAQERLQCLISSDCCEYLHVDSALSAGLTLDTIEFELVYLNKEYLSNINDRQIYRKSGAKFIWRYDSIEMRTTVKVSRFESGSQLTYYYTYTMDHFDYSIVFQCLSGDYVYATFNRKKKHRMKFRTYARGILRIKR